ncbi:MAG: 16S rRNA (adenine(1518)-N(6)/adenine(1519)-N(6))-dimethyltransferase RsmA [Candidatus Dormibacteria bacterium]
MSRLSGELTDPAVLRAVTRSAGLVASRRLGQNFLVDGGALAAIVEALDPGPDDTVVEVGPGAGTLTGALADRAGRVVAIDVDERCVTATRSTMAGRGNVTVVRGDALVADPAGLGVRGDWLAAGNLPYNITTPLLARLFGLDPPPRRGVFVVQREVAARLAAAAGGWSLATLVVRSRAGVERLGDLPPESFEPAPKVHSSIVRLHPAEGLVGERRERAIRIAKAAFQVRRKMLRHGITRAAGGDEAAGVAWLAAAAIDPSRRPGTLGVEEWGALADAAAALGTSR